MLSLLGCFERQNNWKSIQFDDCGSLKIPQEWNVSENGGYIYVLNSELKPVMIQSFSYSGFDDNQEGKSEDNDFYTVQNLKTVSSQVLSNGAVFGEAILLKNGIQIERLFIEIGYERRILFIVWDDEINLDYLKRIANTFKSY